MAQELNLVALSVYEKSKKFSYALNCLRFLSSLLNHRKLVSLTPLFSDLVIKICGRQYGKLLKGQQKYL